MLSAVTPISTATFASGSVTQLASMSVTANTADKPQSKLWMNDGLWFCVMPDKYGTWIWRLDGTQWDHVLNLSTNKTFHADVFSQGDTADILLLDLSKPQNSELASVQYVAGGRGTYEFWTTRPNLVTIPLSSHDETATLTIDSTGRMWVSSDTTTTIEVRYSDFPYLSFSNPITIGTGISTDDISDITAMPDGSIRALWSNQVAKRFYFRTHEDGADPTDWSTPEIAAGQSALKVGHGMADDHLNFAAGTDGTLYAAVKTSYDKSGYPKIALLIRRPDGTWDPLFAVDGAGTRPQVLLDESIGRLLIVYTTSESGGNIVYKETALDHISFSPRITILKGKLNNVTTTKQNVTDQIVVMASSGNKTQSALLQLSIPTDAANTTLHVYAGADQVIQSSAEASLQGSAEYDRLPNPMPVLSALWTMVSGSGIASFAQQNALATTASFSAAGTYVLRLTVDDGTYTTSDDVTVVVTPDLTI